MEAKTQSTSTVIIFVTRKPGTSLEQFRSYYEDKHIPWVAPFVFTENRGLISYTRNYIERDGAASSFPMGGAENFDYDCVTQLVFRDVQHRDATLTAFHQYEDKIAADEENFMDRSKTKVMFITESVASVVG